MLAARTLQHEGSERGRQRPACPDAHATERMRHAANGVGWRSEGAMSQRATRCCAQPAHLLLGQEGGRRGVDDVVADERASSPLAGSRAAAPLPASFALVMSSNTRLRLRRHRPRLHQPRPAAEFGNLRRRARSSTAARQLPPKPPSERRRRAAAVGGAARSACAGPTTSAQPKQCKALATSRHRRRRRRRRRPRRGHRVPLWRICSGPAGRRRCRCRCRCGAGGSSFAACSMTWS